MLTQIKIKIIITDRNSRKKITVDQLIIIIFFLNIDDYFSYFIIAYYIDRYANSLLNGFFSTEVINVYKTNLFVQLSFPNNAASLYTYR